MAMKYIAIILLFTQLAGAATYYVDYVGGNDASAGTSSGTAWQHSPDDANATGTANSTTLAAGDTVIFKGGVSYRGVLNVTVSGDDGNPITYDGNTAGTFGTGKAIIDGTAEIGTAWTQCTDSADAGGNANFANIYWTTVPSGVADGWNQVIMDGTNQLYTAQHPNPPDRFLWDVVTEWLSIDYSLITATTLTDTVYLTQSSSTYWDEAWVGIWGSGNVMYFRAVTNFNTGTDTIGFATIVPYTSGTRYYSMFNHPALIDQAGETAVNVAANRLYVWPTDSGNMSGHTWSVGVEDHAFVGSSIRNVVIKGFVFRGLFSTVNQSGQCAVANFTPSAYDGSVGRNNKFLSNEVYFVKSMDRDRLVSLNGGNNVEISDNIIRDSFGAGTWCGGTNTSMLRNFLNRITGTGLYMVGSTNSIIASNTVLNLKGTHANGISVYTGADRVTLANNIVSNCQSLMTFEDSGNLTFRNNFVHAGDTDYRINDWGGMTGTNSLYNETYVGNSADKIHNSATASGVTWVIKNCIIDGGGRPDSFGVRSNNIYLGLQSWQEAPDWTLQPGESVETEADTFANHAAGNWTPKVSGPADGTGVDFSSLFTSALNGERTVPWDIGAFGAEASAAGTTQSATIGTGVSIQSIRR